MIDRTLRPFCAHMTSYFFFFLAQALSAARIYCNVADDARQAAYLSVLPKNPFFTFSNEEMLILTRRLLYLVIHLHIPGISKCYNNPKHANCDSKGTQMSVCAKGGYCIQTHD